MGCDFGPDISDFGFWRIHAVLGQEVNFGIRPPPLKLTLQGVRVGEPQVYNIDVLGCR
ncbi:hypothetical protein GGTG_12864 [Gaeumannomyces tritici R3-111a-1]|uniref:Uncharacterized protein n=1 Tax=Gaeumannomyces tritici (strain R3-111a-1) TaxID=644352 RepID=J3PH84_GAET3|nr:hypothetical protein GGTG_12864 [Gaeumannomyces tritici R3-111a-1]EJT69244.1 hypothetical protein GGTG_12864 [Gaeumannomyces tritici R3-111a-1]